MSDKPVILLCGVEFHGSPEQEEKFNTWYTETHSPFVFKFEGVSRTTRYKLIHLVRADREAPKYLAIYEFEDKKAFEEWHANEFSATYAQRKEVYSDEVWEMQWGAVYEAIKVWKK